MLAAMAGLAALGAPAWAVLAAWYVPAVGVGVWTLLRPRPAVVTDDDDAWSSYAIRLVMVGEDTANSPPVRAVAAVAFGGPVGWALALLLILELVGLV